MLVQTESESESGKQYENLGFLHAQLRYMGIIHPCFSAIVTKVDNFGIVELASLDNVALPK